jgi:hypothetical protein
LFYEVGVPYISQAGFEAILLPGLGQTDVQSKGKIISF